ncbi:hypothetical protein TNCV_1038271 [Trichonephila clavipes]|uniref:Uncharacterized protein n=1 Tax=Trichonephila clavipes TaxID=2585209 RepID=A0A8X6VVX4_TRICX|nr:hypothetical protein TNCV_1038271 [Trichonephila clavipes]
MYGRRIDFIAAISKNMKIVSVIRIHILISHPKTHLVATFGAPASSIPERVANRTGYSFGSADPASSVTGKKHYGRLELFSKVTGFSGSRSPSRLGPLMYFFRSKTFGNHVFTLQCFSGKSLARVCLKYGRPALSSKVVTFFSYWISDSDCPSQNTAGAKFSRSKAFEVRSCLGVSKVRSSGIDLQSYRYFWDAI